MKYVVVLDLASSTCLPPVNKLDLLTGIVFDDQLSAKEYINKISNCPSVTSFKQSVNNDNEFRVVICEKYDGILYIIRQRDGQLRYDVDIVSRSREVVKRFSSLDAANKSINTLCDGVMSDISTGPWWSPNGYTICRMDITFVRQNQNKAVVIKKIPYKDAITVITECYFSRWHKVRKPLVISSRASYCVMAALAQIVCYYIGAMGASAIGSLIGALQSYIVMLGICSIVGDFVESLARKIIYRREPSVLDNGYGHVTG